MEGSYLSLTANNVIFRPPNALFIRKTFETTDCKSLRYTKKMIGLMNYGPLVEIVYFYIIALQLHIYNKFSYWWHHY